MDEFIFRFGVEGEAEFNRLVHKPCKEEIELIDFESLATLITVVEIHQKNCNQES